MVSSEGEGEAVPHAVSNYHFVNENDLLDHANIIREAVEKDETLTKSKFLVSFLEEKPQKKKAVDEDTVTGTATNFIVDDDEVEEFEEYDGSDEEEDLFDSVCAICDNGGDILCCEGRCMRSFHATVEAGSDSSCKSLGLSNEQVEAIQNFFCKNCQYKRHQCFACGELGSSDKSAGAEVFPCVSATCGRFYHPRCVAKLLHRESAADAEELQKKIADGESFTCPTHKCIVCKQGENKMDPDLQFAVCRRCPKSYHRKCLSKKISFEDVDEEDIVQRAWEDLIPNRILIYCLKHEIDDELGTPIRNHIKFPDDGRKNKRQVLEKLQKKEKVLQKKRILDSAHASRKGSHGKLQKGVDFPSVKVEDGSLKKTLTRFPSSSLLKKQKVGDASIKSFKKCVSTKITKSFDGNKTSLGDRLFDNWFNKGSDKSRKEDTPGSEPKPALTDMPVIKKKGVPLPLDDASKKRILALVKDAGSSITLEKIIEKHKMPTTNVFSSRNVVDKTLTLGKVQGTVEAICAALKKLEAGCSVEDAKIVCEPELLNQIAKWKNKLGGYLAPFLNGARYTSYGRHFTKVDKLKAIVDLLHPYVQDGDMLVDFCCGSNDFSWFMKEKLEKIGTRCAYKNYDLVQAKNDFNFEKRDWMTVRPKDLPMAGSKLIMGLNPPFGKNARDANKFIDKALEFKPKLLILIVPPETERPDKKNPPYDLVWEDNEMLAGKSFYLPGSVDVNDNQLEDWNMNTSLLYLWSRPDWTAKHKAIAQKYGHPYRLQGPTTQHKMPVSDKAVTVHDVKSEIPTSIDDMHLAPNVLENHKKGFLGDRNEKEARVHSNSSHGKNLPNEDSNNRGRETEKHGRESGKREREPSEKHETESSEKRERESSEMSPALKERGVSEEIEWSPLSETYDKLPRLSPHIGSHRRSLEDNRSSEPPEFPHFLAGYGENNQEDDIDMMCRAEPFSGGNRGWSRGTSPNRGRDYEVRNHADQFPGYTRETTDNRAPSIPDFEQNSATHSSIRAKIALYGQQPHRPTDVFPGQRSDGYLGGGDPRFSSSYSHPAGPSYDRTNTSGMSGSTTMQRYAPRLDNEMNHTSVNPSSPTMPLPSRTAGRRNVIPDAFSPQTGYRGDSMGFPPGSHRSFSSQHSSSGWPRN